MSEFPIEHSASEQPDQTRLLKDFLEFFETNRAYLNYHERLVVDFCREVIDAAITKEWLTDNSRRIYSNLFRYTDKGQYIGRKELPEGMSGREFANVLDNLEYETIEFLSRSGVDFYAPAVGERFDLERHVSEDRHLVFGNIDQSKHNTVYSIVAPGMEFGNDVLQKSLVNRYLYDRDIKPTLDNTADQTPDSDTPPAESSDVPIYNTTENIDYEAEFERAANPRGRDQRA